MTDKYGCGGLLLFLLGVILFFCVMCEVIYPPTDMEIWQSEYNQALAHAQVQVLWHKRSLGHFGVAEEWYDPHNDSNDDLLIGTLITMICGTMLFIAGYAYWLGKDKGPDRESGP